MPSENCGESRSSCHRLSIFLHRPQHADVGEASAQNAGHGLLNLRLASFGILVQECLGRHDDAVQAEAALGGLLLDERLLDWMRLFGSADAFKSRDLGALDRLQRRYA